MEVHPMEIEYRDKIDRSFRLLELLLDQTNVYHHHKETMANAGMITQLTILAGLFSVAEWPPEWVPSIQTTYFCLSARGLSQTAFVAVWLLVNVFMRWQLRNRRWAAIFCAAIEETLRKWARSNPESEELDAYGEEAPKEKFLPTFIDKHLFPYRSATLHSDVSRKGWPNGLVSEWIKQEEATLQEPLSAELLLSVGSVLTLVLGLVRLANQ